jgi:anaerobic magnesium-protoporphyrin IX monomethyl ester cyclase
MKKTKPIILLYSPPSDPTQPYSSLPTLTGYLRSHKFTVIQKDLGIELFDELLSPRMLLKACRSANARAKDANLYTDQEYLARFYKLAGVSEYIIEHIEKAKKIMRDKNEFYNYDQYQWAVRLLKSACDLVSLPHHPTILKPSDYETNYEPTFEGFREATANRIDNVFFDIFKNKIVPEIVNLDPLLIGISVTYHFQIIPAFTLSRLFKLAAPGIHISVGGAIIQHMERALLGDPECFLYADSFCTGEGETALLTLAENLSSDEEKKPVPNMIMKGGGHANECNLRIYEDINNIPCPDFHGLELDRYLSPEPILLLSSSRGCYYGKCAFCDVSKNTRRNYRKMRKEHLISCMMELYEEYGAKRFFFCDDAVPPANMRKISEVIMEKLPDATWGAEARFEKTFSSDFISILRKGGCRFLLFGLESASQRVLNAMNKGNTIENDIAVLKSCKKNGIYVNLQTFIGFPTETAAEAQKTVNFLINNERNIACYGLGSFLLERDTPVHLMPERYGISNIYFRNDAFGDYLDYETLIGMTRADIEIELKLAQEKLRPIFASRTNFLAGASGGHSLLYFSHYDYDEIYKIWKKMSLPQWEDKPDIYDLVLDISPTLLFSHPPIKAYSYEHTAFCSKTWKQFPLLPSEYRLLELCNGKRNVGDILSLWISEQTKEFGTKISLLARGSAIIRDYLRKGLVIVLNGCSPKVDNQEGELGSPEVDPLASELDLPENDGSTKEIQFQKVGTST